MICQLVALVVTLNNFGIYMYTYETIKMITTMAEYIIVKLFS